MLYSALRSGVKGRRGVKVVKRLLEPEIVGGSEGNGYQISKSEKRRRQRRILMILAFGSQVSLSKMARGF